MFDGEYAKKIAVECLNSSKSNTCVSIFDSIAQDDNNQFFIVRLLYGGIEKSSIIKSSVKLKNPKWLIESNIDTKNWKIDDGMDRYLPNAILFDHMIRYGSYKQLDHNLKGHVIQIGVATGGLLTFLTRHFPNLKVTGVDIDPLSKILPAKWFGYQKTWNSEILITDGAQYIIDLANNKKSIENDSIDAILIDACAKKTETYPLNCPGDVFTSVEFLNAASKLIGSKGIVSFNVLQLNRKHFEVEKLFDKIKQHFLNCFMVPNPVFTNWSIGCRNNFNVSKNSKILNDFYENLGMESYWKKIIGNKMK